MQNITAYIIKRMGDQKYVAKPGSLHSYTNRLEDARIFSDAEVWREKCGNEVAIPLDKVLG
jgi:hypothetical protein